MYYAPVNARLAAIVGGLAALTVIIVLVVGRRPAPEPAAPVAPVAAPAPKAAPTKKAEEPAPAAPVRPRAPRETAPKPEAAPEAAPVAEPSPDAGTLRIDADVPGAQVFIDRQFVGAVPVTVPNVAPGPHRLNVSAQGYEGIAESIDVTPGPRDIRVAFKEVRLDVKLDVVHKHRFGSCRGRLVATPQGLKYDTTEKGDAFSTGLLTLEVFEVDYLAKNLKVGVKGGKKYDFTDPGGNADNLFVFHRDVDKARDRLRRGDAPALPQ